MKANRKNNRIIILSAIITIILCLAAFWLGAYYGGNVKNNSNNADNENITGSDNMTDRADSSSDTDTNSTDTPDATDNSTDPSDSSVITPEVTTAPDDQTDSTSYSNKDYGFDFILPGTWDGYKVVTEKWKGTSISGDNSGEVIENGPIIRIRNPKWTNKEPYQDIPIMIFTLKQWKLIEKESMAVGAAPIGPSRLGSNSKYVFALPARYNYAFPKGYEEVEDIMSKNPLTPTENIK